MEEEQIIEKIKVFLEEKAELNIESCYFITKKLNEEYWEDIQEEITEEEPEDAVVDDFDGIKDIDEDSELDDEGDQDDLPEFDDVKPEVKEPIIKKPKIKVKKEEQKVE